MREVPVPTIGVDDVLLKVESVGVCGSDLHQWHGTHSWPVNYPCVLGHEFGGVILQAGSGVKRFKEGDRVVSETAAVIGLFSPLTRAGQYNLDPSRKGFGYGVDGAMASFVRVPDDGYRPREADPSRYSPANGAAYLRIATFIRTPRADRETGTRCRPAD